MRMRLLRGVPLALAMVAAADAGETVLKPYGFVRLDAIVNDSPMSHPQFPMWVLSETASPSAASVVAKDEGEISVHPRLTRVGLDLEKATVGSGFALAGKVEADFQNGGSESRQAVRMRHGYLTVGKGSWEILAGQTWDVIAPLYPFVNHDALMWNAGNPGDRRPQVRFTLTPRQGKSPVRVAVAAGMPNAVNNRDLDGNGVRDGAYAMVPAVQGLVEVSTPAVLVGVSGHFHRDRVVSQGTSGQTSTDFDAMLVAGHVRVKIGPSVTVAGEAFTAENADDVRAGIGQGINSAGREIATKGGWGEVQLKVSPAWTLAAGATLDDPDDADLDSGMRSRNLVGYGAARLSALGRLQVGLELLHWKTDYAGAPDGDANRVDLWSTLSF
jgi:hypothetical protein